MFNEESLPYIEAFLEETTEQLQELEGKLIFLEKNPSDRTCLDDIFRIAHNLKGNAATVGFEEIAILAHRMEDLLDGMRKGRVHPSGEITDTLLTCLDALKGLVGKACGEGGDVLELEDLVNKLEHLIHGGYDTGAITDSRKENELLIKLEDNCGMKAARACVVLKTLEELVRIVDAEPSFDEIKQHGFEGTQINVRFFTTESLDIIKEALQAIPDVKEVKLFSEVKDEKEVAPRIDVGARLNPQALEERLRERRAGRAIVDLTGLCELSPAGLSRLLWARKLTGVEFTLPRHPHRKEFLELLGFGESARCSRANCRSSN